MTFGVEQDIIKIRVHMKNAGRDIYNLWSYAPRQQPVTQTMVEECNQLFTTMFYDGGGFVQQALHGLTSVISSQAWSMRDNSKYDAILVGAAGAQSGLEAPPFVVATFKCVRPNPAYRHGYKRFSSLPANEFDGITMPDPGGRLLAIALNMTNVLEGVESFYDPFVPKGAFDPAVGQDGFIVDAVTGPQQGTQNTRKD